LRRVSGRGGLPPRRRRGRRVPDRVPLRLLRPPAGLAGLARAGGVADARRAARRRADAHPGPDRARGLVHPARPARRAAAAALQDGHPHLGDDLPPDHCGRRGVGAADRGLHLVLRLAVTTLVTVSLMTWVVMPRVTALLRRWLYPGRQGDGPAGS